MSCSLQTIATTSTSSTMTGRSAGWLSSGQTTVLFILVLFRTFNIYSYDFWFYYANVFSQHKIVPYLKKSSIKKTLSKSTVVVSWILANAWRKCLNLAWSYILLYAIPGSNFNYKQTNIDICWVLIALRIRTAKIINRKRLPVYTVHRLSDFLMFRDIPGSLESF